MLSLTSVLAYAATLSGLVAAVDIPEGCPVPDRTITNLHWFNGSSSLNCFGADRSQNGCYHGANWLQPTNATDCRANNGSWVPLCATGFQSYQPWGYGSPEFIQLDFDNGNSCYDTYKGYRNYEIGAGRIDLCSSHAENIINFYASSAAESSTARIEWISSGSYAGKCDNGSTINYSGSVEFELDCDIDDQLNSTCTAGPITVPVTEYSINN